MEELVNLFHGFAVVVQPFNLVLMVIGIVLGVMIWQQLPSSALSILGLLLGINLVFSGFSFLMLAMSGPAPTTAAAL